MTEEFDVDAKTTEEMEQEHIPIPKNTITVGRIKDDDVKVYIRQETFHELERMARSDVTSEVGTVLLGNYTRQKDKIHVVITEFIEAKHTDPETTTLTFTHETWDYVNEQHALMYDGLRIVGWQHTHPNYGIYLSNYDIFLQENFFNMPFQVAYVIDPVQNKRGFYQWKDDEIEKLNGFYVYDEVGRDIKVDKSIKKKATSLRKPGAAPYTRVLFVVLVALAVACALLIAYALMVTNKANTEQEKLTKEKIELQKIIDSQDEQISEYIKTIREQQELRESIQESLLDSIISSENLQSIESIIEKIKSGELTLENQEEILKQLEDFKENNSETEEELMVFMPYIVQSGDNLTSICKDHDLDYGTYANIILSVNGISNQDRVLVGQKILLPLPINQPESQ